VYPLSAERFVRDASARCPRSRILPSVVGGSYRLDGGTVDLDPVGSRHLCEPHSLPEEPYRPFVVPDLVDPDLEQRGEAALRAVIEPWIQGALTPALGRAPTSALALEVVYPTTTDGYTFLVHEGSVSVERTLDPDWDVLNAVAASHLAGVIESRRHWGEPLLAGLLRSARRAYTVTDRGVESLRIAPIFLYYAISYEESTERWLERQLAAVVKPP
jgi:hypothetical protein